MSIKIADSPCLIRDFPVAQNKAISANCRNQVASIHSVKLIQLHNYWIYWSKMEHLYDY